mgnify:CR=1 FL=1
MQNRVAGYIAARFRTEDQTDCRIIAVRAFQLIVHADIHIHLPDILMRNLGVFRSISKKHFKM